jgi:hypothetical protein
MTKLEKKVLFQTIYTYLDLGQFKELLSTNPSMASYFGSGQNMHQ